MGRSNRNHRHLSTKSHTLPSSPTHSDFEFTISHSPHQSSSSAAALCRHADELFYNGHLLPLHLSSSSSTTASRHSTTSSSDHHFDCDSSRPSSAADEQLNRLSTTRKPSKYFSLSKFSSGGAATAARRVRSTAKEVLWKYFKKVKPLYEKLSQKRPAAQPPAITGDQESMTGINYSNKNISQSFSGNLMYPRRRRSYVSSCPSMMSSPRHGDSGFGLAQAGRAGTGWSNSDASSMEELQSAIQGAIAHCKNSMMKEQ